MWDSMDIPDGGRPRGVTPDTIRRWADATVYDEVDPAPGPVSPERRDREMHAIREISRALIAPFHLGQFVYEIITTCCRLLGTEAGSVLLQEAGTGKLHFFWVRGRGANGIRELILDKGQGIAGWCAETGRPAMVNRVEEDARFFVGVDERTGFETRSILCAPVLGPDGVIGVIEAINKEDRSGFVQEDLDLLEVICAETALAIQSFRTREQAQRSDRMALLGSMASSIIHDLKNPMTIIKGYTYLLSQEHPDTQKECDRINTEMDRLTELAEEILGVVRGTSRVQPEWLDVPAFIDEFARSIEARLQLDGLALEVESLFEGKACMDVRRIRRALLNLVKNAIEALSSGGRIILRSERVPEGLRISLEDDGPGIPEEIRIRLFDPFHASKTSGGAGLGMAIVKNIIDAHGGDLMVESAPGRGTKIAFTLPVDGPGD